MACGTHRRHHAGCKPCRRNGRLYIEKRELAIANGTWQFPVPVAKVRAHIKRLRAKGMTYQAIAAAAWCSDTNIRDVAGRGVKGRARKFVQGPLAKDILAVEVPARKLAAAPRRRAGMVNATGSSRRVQALAVNNYGLLWQARTLGIAESTFSRLARCAPGVAAPLTTQVRAETARRIAELYEEYRDRINPCSLPTNTTHAAQRHGWYGPDAWDCDTIDDLTAAPYSHVQLARPPRATLSLATVYAALAGGGSFDEMTTAERVEVVTILAERGWNDARIGAHIRNAGENITAFRSNHGISTRYQPVAAYAA